MDKNYCKKLITDCWSDLQPRNAIGGNETTSLVFTCDVIHNGKVSEFVSKQVVKVILVEVTKNDAQQISIQGSTSEEFYQSKVKKALQEVDIMKKLMNQPNIVRINDFGKTEVEIPEAGSGTPHKQTYILIRMDQMKDCNELIQSYAKESSGEPQKLAEKLAADILNALSICEKLNYIHRDIKPENIFYEQTENIYTFMLGDFGVSRLLPSNNSSLTTAGTAYYIAPEIYSKQKGVDVRADLYSLGIVLYQIVNHNRLPLTSYKDGPITSEKVTTAVNNRLSGTPLPDPDNCSEDFGAFVRKLCAFQKEDRFASADEALQSLRRLQYERTQSRDAVLPSRSDTSAAVKQSYDSSSSNSSEAREDRSERSPRWYDYYYLRRRFKIVLIILICAAAAVCVVFLAGRFIRSGGIDKKESAESAVSLSEVTSGTSSEENDTAEGSTEETAPLLTSVSDTESSEEASTEEATVGATEENESSSASTQKSGTTTTLASMTVVDGKDLDTKEDVYDKIGNYYRTALLLNGDSHTYKLGGKYQRFVSLVACYDAADLEGSDIEIYLDDSNQPAEVMHIDIDMEPAVLDVDVSGADEITIVHSIVNYFDACLLVDSAFYTESADADQKVSELEESLAKVSPAKDTPLSSMSIIGTGSDTGLTNIEKVTDYKDTLGNYYREAMRLNGDTAEYYLGGRYKRFVGWLSCSDYDGDGSDLSVYLDKSNTAAYTQHLSQDMEPTLVDIDLTDAKYITFNLDCHNDYINEGIFSDAEFYVTDEAADAAIADHQ